MTEDELAYGLMQAAVRGGEATEAFLQVHPEALDARMNHVKETALHYLAIENEIEAVKLLAAHGADVNTLNASKSTALHSAVRLGLLEMVALLLGLGANPNLPDDLDGAALMIACGNLDAPVTEILLRAGADPNQTNDLEGTALYLAVKSASEEKRERQELPGFMIPGFEEQLADLNERIASQKTDDWPVRAPPQPLAVLKLLLQYGADPNAKVYEETPLHQAAMGGNPEICRLLLEHGAHPRAEDGYGKMPLEQPIPAEFLDGIKQVFRQFDPD